MSKKRVAVFGASGLIGEHIAASLQEAGVPVVAVARRFTPAQRGRFGPSAVETDFMALDRKGVIALLDRHSIEVVINCVGALQDSPRGRTHDVHVGWTAKLLEAQPELLIHLSMTGEAAGDRTSFSRTKHQADNLIARAAGNFVILRPGFVLAPRAFGGSALLRALAILPFSLAEKTASGPLTITYVDDLAATVAVVLARWGNGARGWRVTWDVMSSEATTVDDVVNALSQRLGGPVRRLRLPAWLMRLGALAGDAVSWLGWLPPIRSTLLSEMQRGVSGDPTPWIADTGLRPTLLADALRRLPAGVQERWFARLYLLKALLLVTLSVFWVASGVVALTVAFPEALALLRKAGLPEGIAGITTYATGALDLAIGLGIAWRCSARASLWTGFAASIAYLAASVVLLPELWGDPVGSMVKTIPAAVLMLVAIAILDER